MLGGPNLQSPSRAQLQVMNRLLGQVMNRLLEQCENRNKRKKGGRKKIRKQQNGLKKVSICNHSIGKEQESQ